MMATGMDSSLADLLKEVELLRSEAVERGFEMRPVTKILRATNRKFDKLEELQLILKMYLLLDKICAPVVSSTEAPTIIESEATMMKNTNEDGGNGMEMSAEEDLKIAYQDPIEEFVEEAESEIHAMDTKTGERIGTRKETESNLPVNTGPWGSKMKFNGDGDAPITKGSESTSRDMGWDPDITIKNTVDARGKVKKTGDNRGMVETTWVTKDEVEIMYGITVKNTGGTDDEGLRYRDARGTFYPGIMVGSARSAREVVVAEEAQEFSLVKGVLKAKTIIT